jgi:sugar (pentulose or hexulose) kinase
MERMLHSSAILAIDFGTSRCKAGVIDATGGVLSISARELGLQKSGTGLIETSESVWRSTVLTCIREALSEAGTSRISIVSVTAQTACPVCFDDDDRPLGPIISHLDSRAGKQLQKASQAFPESYVASKLVGNLRWLKESEPQTFRRIKQVCDVKEYVGKLLTGKLTHDSMQLPRSRISKMADMLGIGEETFGAGHDFATPIGVCKADTKELGGLEPGTPVLVCPFDGLTGAVGSGLVNQSILTEIAGTTDFIATTNQGGGSTVSHSYPSVAWNLIDGTSPRSRLRVVYTSPPLGFFYDWFRGILYGMSGQSPHSSVERELAKSVSGEMLFVPKFSFETHGWRGSGQMLNIELGKTRSDIMRAVMEGIAMDVKLIINSLKEDGASVRSINLSGGGSRSEVWNQIRADIYGVPVSLLQTSETGCLGGAVYAAASLGLYRDLKAASEGMVHVAREYHPNPIRMKLYEKAYQRFRTSLSQVTS